MHVFNHGCGVGVEELESETFFEESELVENGYRKIEELEIPDGKN